MTKKMTLSKINKATVMLNENMTLAELLTLIKSAPANKEYGVYYLKTRCELVAAHTCGSTRLTVYRNGFALMEDGDSWGIARVDTTSPYDYDPSRTARNAERRSKGKPQELRSDIDISFFMDKPWTLIASLVTYDDAEQREADFGAQFPSYRHLLPSKEQRQGYTDSFEDELIFRMYHDEAVKTLTDKQRECYEMYMQGYSITDIAEKSGTLPRVAMQRVSRSVEKIDNYRRSVNGRVE